MLTGLQSHDLALRQPLGARNPAAPLLWHIVMSLAEGPCPFALEARNTPWLMALDEALDEERAPTNGEPTEAHRAYAELLDLWQPPAPAITSPDEGTTVLPLLPWSPLEESELDPEIRRWLESAFPRIDAPVNGHDADEPSEGDACDAAVETTPVHHMPPAAATHDWTDALLLSVPAMKRARVTIDLASDDDDGNAEPMPKRRRINPILLV